MQKKKDISASGHPKGMTPILPIPYGSTVAGTGIPTFSGTRPATDADIVADQTAWLMRVAGVPLPQVQEVKMKKFHIEALYPGGQYDGTTKGARCLSDAIDIMLSSRVGVVVARGFVAEIQKGEVRTFQLLNGVRVY